MKRPVHTECPERSCTTRGYRRGRAPRIAAACFFCVATACSLVIVRRGVRWSPGRFRCAAFFGSLSSKAWTDESFVLLCAYGSIRKSDNAKSRGYRRRHALSGRDRVRLSRTRSVGCAMCLRICEKRMDPSLPLRSARNGSCRAAPFRPEWRCRSCRTAPLRTACRTRVELREEQNANRQDEKRGTIRSLPFPMADGRPIKVPSSCGSAQGWPSC